MQEVENEITINVPNGEDGLHASKTKRGQAQTVKIKFIQNFKTKKNRKLENGLKVLKFM